MQYAVVSISVGRGKGATVYMRPFFIVKSRLVVSSLERGSEEMVSLTRKWDPIVSPSPQKKKTNICNSMCSGAFFTARGDCLWWQSPRGRAGVGSQVYGAIRHLTRRWLHTL